MIDTGKYISQNGIAYEVVAYAINSETDEQVIIYREIYNKNKIFTCTEKWWESQVFIPIGNYTSTGVTMYSSEAEKINLFISLFVGRDDVYAKRWESKKGSFRSQHRPIPLDQAALLTESSYLRRFSIGGKPPLAVQILRLFQ